MFGGEGPYRSMRMLPSELAKSTASIILSLSDLALLLSHRLLSEGRREAEEEEDDDERCIHGHRDGLINKSSCSASSEAGLARAAPLKHGRSNREMGWPMRTFGPVKKGSESA